MAWVYLILAAILEAFWMFSLKFLSFEKFKTLTFSGFFQTSETKIWLPLAGYIFFGIANTFFLSLAMKNVSTAIAFTVWTAISIVFIKMGEVLYFQDRISTTELFFLGLIMVGIIGLKIVAK